MLCHTPTFTVTGCVDKFIILGELDVAVFKVSVCECVFYACVVMVLVSLIMVFT